jgi:23S rRNA (uracil1939-C5)-methyltransferase
MVSGFLFEVKKQAPFEIQIERLSHEGRGVGRVDGKTVFVRGALPGETATCERTRKHKSFDEAEAIAITEPNPDRVEPACVHFVDCGGCSMQHLRIDAQLAHKQSVLLEQFKHFAQTQPEQVIPPLQAEPWGYRHKARLAVRHVPKKGGVLVGFREHRCSRFVTVIDSCKVLHPSIGEQIPAFKDLLNQLSIPQHIPQLEIAIGDTNTAVIMRHLKPFNSADIKLLHDFAIDKDLDLYLQPKGLDTIHLLAPVTDSPRLLSYTLPDFDLTLSFKPTDFTQVNPRLNEKMVAQAIDLLDLKPTDTVLDLFCGLGNFSLAIATRCASVVGVEGSDEMVGRARDNAAANGLDNTEFFSADLAKDWRRQAWATRQYDKILIDPARAGAEFVAENITTFGADSIVYVSCNPATLARDTQILEKNGYQLRQAGIMDMFSHTSHIEAMAHFVKSVGSNGKS